MSDGGGGGAGDGGGGRPPAASQGGRSFEGSTADRKPDDPVADGGVGHHSRALPDSATFIDLTGDEQSDLAAPVGGTSTAGGRSTPARRTIANPAWVNQNLAPPGTGRSNNPWVFPTDFAPAWGGTITNPAWVNHNLAPPGTGRSNNPRAFPTGFAPPWAATSTNPARVNQNLAPPGTGWSNSPGFSPPDFAPPWAATSINPGAVSSITAPPGTLNTFARRVRPRQGTERSNVPRSLMPSMLVTTVRSDTSCEEYISLFPVESYKIGEKAEKAGKDYAGVGRMARLKKKFEKEGMQTRVEGIILVKVQQGHPCVVFLGRQCEFRFQLPGGRLKLGENEIEGLKRKLNSRLGVGSGTHQTNWQIGDCVAKWWRLNFDHKLQPYRTGEPKECIKLFIVHLAGGERMVSPERLWSASLRYLYDQPEEFGPVYSKIPWNLSRYHCRFV